MCHLLASLGTHHILHVSRIRVKVLYFIITLSKGTELLRAGRQTDKQIVERIDRRTDRWTEKQTDRQTDRQTERWTEGRTDGRADMTKLIVAFRNYAKGPVKRETVMPIKLLQSAAHKMFGKVVSVAVVVSALEPILFQCCKTELHAQYPAPFNCTREISDFFLLLCC
jgi:hypothetical protein